jgi:hypothetical protein
MHKAIGLFNFFELANLICRHISQTSAGYMFGDETENFLFRDLFTADHSRSLKREFFDQVLNQLVEGGIISKTAEGVKVLPFSKRFEFGGWTMRREPGAYSHQDYFKIERDGNPVAEVSAGLPWNGHQMLADAKLISAAPNLLEAVENIIFGFAGTDEDGRTTYTLGRREALQLHAALAKARGFDEEIKRCLEAIEETNETAAV